MNKVKQFIRAYFGFSQTETNGFIVLLLLSALLLLAPILVRNHLHGEPELLESDIRMLDSLVARIEQRQPQEEIDNQPIEISYFLFDPNTTSLENFSKLGIANWLGQRIINYRESGGQFRIKNDLSKIYGLDEELFTNLKPWVNLPERLERQVVKADAVVGETVVLENTWFLNKLDSSQLQDVRGIGPVLSARIVKYRNLVGGYIDWSQLSEVYGLESDVIDEMKKRIKIDENFAPIKINLNTATSAELGRHPYVSNRQAKMTVNFRDQQGGITNAAALMALPLFDSASINKLEPYLEF